MNLSIACQPGPFQLPFSSEFYAEQQPAQAKAHAIVDQTVIFGKNGSPDPVATAQARQALRATLVMFPPNSYEDKGRISTTRGNWLGPQTIDWVQTLQARQKLVKNF